MKVGMTRSFLGGDEGHDLPILHFIVEFPNLTRIPDTFLRKYGTQLSTIATLTVPDGSIWRIGLKKADNKIWFVDGWQDFVQRYSIGVGYFLVFMYEGNSSFIVHVFNLSTAELNYQSAMRNHIEGPCYANYNHIFEEMEDVDSIDLSDLSPAYLASGAMQNKGFAGSGDQLTPGKSHTPALQNLFNGGSKLNRVNWGDGGSAYSSKAANSQGTQSTRDIGVQFNAVEFKRSTEELKLRYSNEESVNKTAKKKRKSESQGEEPSGENEEEAEMRYRFYESASARKRTVTAEERERAINASKAFEPTNPFCRVVLRPSYLYRGCIMYLPSCFAEKNLNGVSGFIKLQLSNGRQWSVRCLYRGGRAKLSQGWFEFTVENNLGEGDVCVFELLRTKEVELQVTVFRVTEDAGLLNSPLTVQQPSQNMSHTKLLNPHLQHRVSSTVKLIRN